MAAFLAGFFLTLRMVEPVEGNQSDILTIASYPLQRKEKTIRCRRFWEEMEIFVSKGGYDCLFKGQGTSCFDGRVFGLERAIGSTTYEQQQ